MKKKKDSPPIHKYQVVDYSILRKPTIDRFCKTLKEGKEFVLKNNGKFIGNFKTEYKIEETNSYKEWNGKKGAGRNENNSEDTKQGFIKSGGVCC